MAPHKPNLLWAQRKDKLYLTIDLQDVKDEKIELTPERLVFSGTTGGQEYALDVAFNKEVDPTSSDSKRLITGRHIFLVIAKKDSGEYWPRLTKTSSKGDTHIKCDWDKWVDEDEEDQDKFDLSQFGGGNFQNFQNMNFGDFGGEEEEDGGAAGGKDSDDDEEALPDLVQ